MNDEETLRDAAAGNDAEALQNVQIKKMMLGRRGFLLKSASVAGSIASPTLIGAGALAIARPAMAYDTNTIYASDDHAFYQETIAAGLPEWKYATAEWEKLLSATDEGSVGYQIKGTLVLYNKHLWSGFFGFPVVTYAFKLHITTHQFNIGSGYYALTEDLDTSRDQSISEVPEQPYDSGPSDVPIPRVTYSDTAPKYSGSELRRRLQYDSDWSSMWQIPISWSREMSLWIDWGNNLRTTNAHHAFTGITSPYVGMLVHQWGSPTAGIAMRTIQVYLYEYRINDAVYERRATLRRTMYLIGGYVRGHWHNIAIDEITDRMRIQLRAIRDALWEEYRAAGRNGADWRGFPSEAYQGWLDQMSLQELPLRAGIVAVLARIIPAGIGTDAARGYYVAMERGGRAIIDLARDNPETDNDSYNDRLPPNFSDRNGGVQAPPRFRGVRATTRGLNDFYTVNAIPSWDNVHRTLNWLQELPRGDWHAFTEPEGMALEYNPEIAAEYRFPAVIPGNIPNATHPDTFNEAVVDAAFEAAIAPAPSVRRLFWLD